MQQIQQEGDVNALYTDDAMLRTLARGATISRFQSEYDEMVHSTAGERRQELADDSQFGQAMRQLIRRYAAGEVASPEALQEEKGRILESLSESGADRDAIGEGKVRIDNLLQIAESVKGAVENGESIDRVMEGMKIYSGESRSGVRTEAHLGKIDQAVEKLQKSKIGSLVGPETVSLAAAVGLGVARVGRGSLMRAFAVTGVPGLIGGVFAGVRENKRVKEERAIHAREIAQGGIVADEGRRAQMEKTRYETVTAKHLTESLNEAFNKEDFTPEELQNAYQALAEADVRIRLSDAKSIDLISFSSVGEVEAERFELDLARARAKVELQRRLGDLPEDFRTSLGIQQGDTAEQALARSTDLLTSLAQDISAKDEAFAKLRKKRVAAAAATGFATSLTIGIAAQEGIAFLNSSYDGLLEHYLHGGNSSSDGTQTVLEGMFHEQDATTHTNIIEASSTYAQHDIGDHSSLLELPDNYSISNNPDGTVNILAPDGSIFADNIKFEADGSLTTASIDALHDKGGLIADLSHTATNTQTTVHDLTVSEYIDHYSADTTQVTRDFWYDNDTDAFDMNELGLHWAGDGGQGADGSFSLSVATMDADGSFHGIDTTSWAEQAQNGTLKFAVSASIDNQDQVFMLDVAPDGSITIPADHPAAQLFSVNEAGQAEFHGGYGEVVEMHGADEAGITHMSPLATIEGDDSISTIPTEVETITEQNVPKWSITPPDIENVVDVPARTVEGFGGPVVVPRRPLERLGISPRQDRDPFVYDYGPSRSMVQMREWLRSMGGPRTRRQIGNSPASMTWVEADGSPVERSVERERSTIANYLNSQFSNNPEYQRRISNIAASLGLMNNDCRVSVNVPAWMEEANLDRLLNQYIDQTDNNGNPLDPSLFEINILVNRKTGAPEDRSVQVIENFIEEYARQHGGVRPNVHYANVEIEPANANVGFVRKLLTDAVLQRSLGRDAQSQPLYIESEDADLMEVDKRTIFNLISKLDRNPHLDAVRGNEGRVPSIIKDNALLLMRRNAWEVFLFNARQKRFRNPEHPSWNSFANRTITGGWNCGYSAEAYAMIGGYKPAQIGEDTSIGERISMMRGDGSYPNLETIGSVPSRTESSPRRFIHEIIQREPAYNNFGEDSNEETIREASLPDLMNRISEYANITDNNKATFEGEAQMFHSWSRRATPTLEDAKEMTRRIMRSVGYRQGDYVFEGDTIRIVNWDNVKRNIENYRAGFDSARNPNRKMVIGGW